MSRGVRGNALVKASERQCTSHDGYVRVNTPNDVRLSYFLPFQAAKAS
jgi:hypothetical protein